MRKILKSAAFALVIGAHILVLCAINFAMPSYKALNIVGTEVKRMDNDGFINKDRVTSGVIRDVYFIYARYANSDDVVNFRNEDTRWGMPFYLKFNSADLQARAVSFAEEKALVQVKYYGWRIPMFNEFFNAISVKKIADESELAMPIFSYIFYILTLISLVWCILFLRKKLSDDEPAFVASTPSQVQNFSSQTSTNSAPLSDF